MRKIHALRDYSHYNDNDLIAEGRKVVLKSTGNPDAADADPTVAEVKTATDNFENANTLAAGGDHQLVTLKGQARDKLETTLSKFAGSIDLVADGNLAVLEGCGLNSSGQPAQHEYNELELSRGEVPNSVNARCRKTDEAGSYAWQIYYGLNPPTDEELWKWKTVTLQIEATLTGINQGDVCVR